MTEEQFKEKLYRTFYDDLILMRLDPCFRKCMIPLMDSDLSCRFNVETDTVESILKTYPHEVLPVQQLLNYIVEMGRLKDISAEIFLRMSLRQIVSQIVVEMQAHEEVSLMYPFVSIPLRLATTKLIDIDADADGLDLGHCAFKLTVDQYAAVVQLRENAKSQYGGVLCPTFLGHWNNTVSDILKIPEDRVFRWIDSARIVQIIKGRIPNYLSPLPGMSRNTPIVPCFATIRRDQFVGMVIGHLHIGKHHPIIQKNMDRSAADGTAENFI